MLFRSTSDVAEVTRPMASVVFMDKRGKAGRQVTEIIEVTGFRDGRYVYDCIYGRSGRKDNLRSKETGIE